LVYTIVIVKEAKIFANGRSQAVRLPKEFRMPGKSVYVRRLGNTVLLLPKRGFWDTMVGACGKFTPDFMSSRDQGTQRRPFPFA
jgi:antitoxin VapB